MKNKFGVNNPLNYAACEEASIERFWADFGYKRQTPFFSDLSIAEWYGKDSILETFESVLKEWGKDKVYFTEFAMSLNWKAWEWADEGKFSNKKLAELYADLWYEAQDYVYNNWDREDRQYFFELNN